MRPLIASIFLVACGGGSSPPGVDGVVGGDDLACESGGTTFPPLDKSCTAAGDCFVARHQIDCCGTFVAVGFNTSSEAAFSTSETTCEAAYPGCGCASRPTQAEDGRTEDLGSIAVRCETNLCRTFIALPP